MATSIEAKVVRSPLQLGSFAAHTTAPLAGFTPDGLLFDGDLTDEQVEAVWWYATSRDDANQAEREALYVRLGEAVAVTPATWVSAVIAELLRYQLGLQQ